MMTMVLVVECYNQYKHPQQTLSKYFFWIREMPTDLYEDMATLNTLYEELCWDPEKPLEFKADYENDQIVIKLKRD